MLGASSEFPELVCKDRKMNPFPAIRQIQQDAYSRDDRSEVECYFGKDASII